MFKFDDEEKVILRFMKEAEEDNRKFAEEYVDELKNAEPELHPFITAWLNNEEPEFEFFGLTSTNIMKWDVCAYIKAVIQMDEILKSPNPQGKIKGYKISRREMIGILNYIESGKKVDFDDVAECSWDEAHYKT